MWIFFLIKYLALETVAEERYVFVRHTLISCREPVKDPAGCSILIFSSFCSDPHRHVKKVLTLCAIFVANFFSSLSLWPCLIQVCMSAFRFRKIRNVVYLIKSKKRGKKKFEPFRVLPKDGNFPSGLATYIELMYSSMRRHSRLNFIRILIYTQMKHRPLGEMGKPWCRTCLSKWREKKKKSMLNVKKEELFLRNDVYQWMYYRSLTFSSLGLGSCARFTLFPLRIRRSS